MNRDGVGGEEEGSSWKEFYGQLEQREQMVVSVEKKAYDVDEETDEEYKTEEELKKKWLVYRDNKEVLMKYWMEDVCQKYSKRLQHERNWEIHLSTLANLYVVKDDAEAFVKHHGLSYRWEWRFAQVATSDGHTDSASRVMYMGQQAKNEAVREMGRSVGEKTYVTIQKGWRYYLQIVNLDKRGKLKEWTDWVYLAKSEYTVGNVGLFAARKFPPGMPVGLYVGRQVWKSKKVGGKVPSDEKLEDVLPGKHKEYQVAIRDVDGRMVVLNPEPLERFILPNGERNEASVLKPLYMGVHYMNDSSDGLESEGSTANKMKRLINTEMLEDGVIVTKKEVGVDEEMYLKYHLTTKEEGEEEGNDKVKEGKDDGRDEEKEEDYEKGSREGKKRKQNPVKGGGSRKKSGGTMKKRN